MGYASYLEDVRNRLDGAMHELRGAPAVGAAASRRKTQALLDACQATLDQLDELRTMVDDPRFDLAYEVTQLDREKEELRAEIQELIVRRDRIRSHAARLEGDGKKAKLELKRLRAEIERKDDEYEALLRANPEAAYGRYWPGRRDTRA
jgi:chromosome segregation ATPase